MCLVAVEIVLGSANRLVIQNALDVQGALADAHQLAKKVVLMGALVLAEGVRQDAQQGVRIPADPDVPQVRWLVKEEVEKWHVLADVERLVAHRVKQLHQEIVVDVERLAVQIVQRCAPAFVCRAALVALIIAKMTAWQLVQEVVKKNVRLLAREAAVALAVILATILAVEDVAVLVVAYAEIRVTMTAGVAVKALVRMDVKILVPVRVIVGAMGVIISAQQVVRSHAVDVMVVMDAGFPAGLDAQVAVLDFVKAFAPGVAILCARMDARETVVRVAIQTVAKVVQEPVTEQL